MLRIVEQPDGAARIAIATLMLAARPTGEDPNRRLSMATVLWSIVGTVTTLRPVRRNRTSACIKATGVIGAPEEYGYFIVGITNCAFSRRVVGQREVTVLSFV